MTFSAYLLIKMRPEMNVLINATERHSKERSRPLLAYHEQDHILLLTLLEIKSIFTCLLCLLFTVGIN